MRWTGRLANRMMEKEMGGSRMVMFRLVVFRRQRVSTKHGLGEFQSDVSVAEPQPPTDIARNRPPQLPPNMNCTLRRSVFASLRSSPAAVGTRRLSLFGYTQAKALVYSKYGVPKDVLRYPPASVIPAVS